MQIGSGEDARYVVFVQGAVRLATTYKAACDVAKEAIEQGTPAEDVSLYERKEVFLNLGEDEDVLHRRSCEALEHDPVCG